MVKRSAALWLGLAVAAACDRGWKSEEADYGVVEVGETKIASGPVGEGEFRADATYVLAVAKNQAAQDLVVTLAGDLVDRDGHVVAPLHDESIRIPAGGERTFALVDKRQETRPTAAAARVRVTGAMKVDYAPPVYVEEGHVYQDGDHAVVTGYVVNSGQGTCKAQALFSFFDQAGHPLSRGSTVLTLDGGGRRGVLRAGPPGSASAQLYVGEVAY